MPQTEISMLRALGEAYADPEAHVADLFRWIERRLDRLELARSQGGDACATLDALLPQIEEEIRSCEHASEAKGVELPLALLCDTLAVSPCARAILVAVAATERDPRLLSRMSRLWPEGRHGDVAFYRDLIGGSALHELSAAGPLARHGLIQLIADRAWGWSTPRLYHRVRLGSRVAGFLAGEIEAPARTLPAALSVRRRGRPLGKLVIAAQVVERVRAALHGGPGRVICLVGTRHAGRKSLAHALIERPLVLLDCARLTSDLSEVSTLVREALCETVLQDGALYLEHLEALAGEPKSAVRQTLGELLTDLNVRVFAGLDGSADGLVDALPNLLFCAVPVPDPFAQSTLWSLLLPDHLQLEPGHGVGWLSTHYSLPAGAIQRCVDEMARGAELRGEAVIEHEHALAAVRRQLGSRFGDLAELVVNTLTWKDLVLPSETLERVLEVVMYFKHRDRLLRDWGFEAKLPYGKSLSVLLSGEPGTGKTMVAGLLAKEMGLELFRVNISKIVDKYIGETEKNLGRIFEEARRGQVALLFDEADSLFGKRTEVRNSTDRYSNLAINFLLQSVESHDGVILLTTNHDKSMDPAFKRRIRFRVHFPFPELKERTALWGSMVPAQAPIAPDTDWEGLAREFDLAGGSIKNAVVRAALHAVEQGGPITEALLRHAGRLESEQMGRLVRAPERAVPKEEG